MLSLAWAVAFPSHRRIWCHSSPSLSRRQPSVLSDKPPVHTSEISLLLQKPVEYDLGNRELRPAKKDMQTASQQQTLAASFVGCDNVQDQMSRRYLPDACHSLTVACACSAVIPAFASRMPSTILLT